MSYWERRLRTFKRMVKEGNAKGLSPVLQKQLLSTAESIGDRLVRYTITSGNVDRQNDKISVDGWQLDNYKANPVVLWGHRASDLPIGKCVELARGDNTLKAVVEYVPLDMPVVGPMAEAVLRMSRTGFLSATSVGFRAIDYEVAEDRDDDDSWWYPLNFLQQELLEFSVVTIPANADALIDPAERLTSLSAEDLNQMLAEAAAQAVRDHDAGIADRQAEQLAAEASAAASRAHRMAWLRAFS
jgi:HK97 family phage prohead protease